MKTEKIPFRHKDLFISIFRDKVFLVGGVVRDFILYKRVDSRQDIDLVVIDHTYAEIEGKLRKFGRTSTVGRSFAVVKFTIDSQTYDVSIPRKDFIRDRDSASHKNFLIDSGPHIRLEEDLSRRDFTCNSIAVRLMDDRIIDPFNGYRAIEEKVIYMTGPETFFDDPLRILRAARFASVHDFTIDPAIYENSRKIQLDELSIERVQEELFRLLLESPRPSKGLDGYFKLTVLEKIFPELYAMTLTIQDAIFHPEQDEFGHHTVWIHTLNTVDICQKLCGQYELNQEHCLALLLAALLHDIGKVTTTRWEYKRGRMTVTSILHDTRGAKLAENFLSGMKIETRKSFPLKKTIINVIKNHHRIYELYRNGDNIGFKAISRVVKELEGLDFLLVLLDFADRQSREPDYLSFTDVDEISYWFLNKKREYNISQETIQPLIMGKDLLKLGVQPGKKMGEYLKKLYELQLDGEFKSKKEGLDIFRKRIQNHKDG